MDGDVRRLKQRRAQIKQVSHIVNFLDSESTTIPEAQVKL